MRFGCNYRMVVIFGFGPGSPEDQGEVAPCVCPNCHNQVFLHHVRSKKSVRLYFVPVVPTARTTLEPFDDARVSGFLMPVGF